MAVNGVEITLGSTWQRHDKRICYVEDYLPGQAYCWRVITVDADVPNQSYFVNRDGVSDLRASKVNLAKRIERSPTDHSRCSDQKQTNPKDLVGVRKAPMSTVSAAVLAEVGVAMLEGACKYGRHNYREVGVRSSVYYDGTMRHLMGWWEGEDIDPDSGLSHVTKAITSLVVLRDAMIQGKLTDDRAPRSAEFYTALNERAAAIIDKYADRNPVHYTIENCVVTK